jgi:hypothetical protein
MLTLSVPARKDLGPKQIEWLKANVPQFKPAKEQADAALAHAAEVASKIEMEGGSIVQVRESQAQVRT